MKARWSTENLLGLLGCFILIFSVHFSDEFSITRDKRSLSTTKKAIPTLKPVKKQGNASAVDNTKQLILDGKIKISELKPCISKAFCEVNSITEQPTYETNKEFYNILDRLKKFIDESEKDLNGSGSVEEEEEDGSASSEESNERPAPGGYGPPGRNYYPPEYRRGKSLKNETDGYKIKKKSKKNKLKLGLFNVNGTDLGESKNKTARVETAEKVEQRAFVARKTRELNVVEDLAALIKISAEIGQALRSPRRCRTLFKKCQMSYEQIINIFNQTQSVESSAPDTEDSESTSKKPTRPATKVPRTTTEAPEASSGEGNRNKKSRHDFSDEDIEYITDTELSQPVRTYSLFPPTEHHDGRHPEEILVEEAFKKYDNTFPVSGAPENLDFLKQKSPKSKKYVMAEKHASSEEAEDEEDGSAESGSREGPDFRMKHPHNRGVYKHRSSSEDNSQEESTKPRRKPSKTSIIKDIEGGPIEQADIENDSDAEIPSSEIDKQHEGPETKQPQPDLPEPEESSEEDDDSSDENGRPKLHPRDEESSEAAPELSDDGEIITKGKKHSKKNSIKLKKQKPEDDQNSSEEDEEPQDELPPKDSQFYNLLQQMNDGKGADGLAAKPHKKKTKKPTKKDEEDEDEEGVPPGWLPVGPPPSQGSGQQSGWGQSGGQQGGQSGWGQSGGQQGGQSGWGQSGGQQGGQSGWGQSGGQQGGQSGWGQSGGQQGGQSGWGQSGGQQGGQSGWGQSSGQQGGQSGWGQSGGQQGGQSGWGQNNQQSTSESSPGFFQSIVSWFSGSKKTSQSSGENSGWKMPYGKGEDEPPAYDDDYKQKGQPSGYPPAPHGLKSGPKYPVEDEEEDDSPLSKRRPHKTRGSPIREGADESSEEEDEEEDDHVVKRSKRPSGKDSRNKNVRNSNKSSSKQHLRSGPPPPMVIVPEAEEHYSPNEEYETVIKSKLENTETKNEQNKQQTNSNKPKPSKDNSEEDSRETSSEEAQQQEAVPLKVQTGIFGKVKEVEKPTTERIDERENQSLLMSTFDTISTKFSTSADKIPDWSEEDNPKKRINVASLSNNGKSKGKYTVVKNRNKNKFNGGSQISSIEVNEKSSEEEEEKKKK